MPSRHGKHVHRNLKLGAKGADVRELQQGINRVFDHFKIDWHVHVDGDYGRHSKKSTLLAEYVIGLSNAQRHHTRSRSVSTYAQRVLRGSRHTTAAMALRRAHRRKHIRRLRRQSHRDQPSGAELGTWDGRQVAGWMVGTRPGPDGRTVNWLAKIKATGRWAGGLYSGFRTPEYSESLCIAQCGEVRCSGTCAGRASNHSQTGPPNWGAVDVVDAAGFQAGANQVGAPFTNHLPADQPHRSYTGY